VGGWERASLKVLKKAASLPLAAARRRGQDSFYADFFGVEIGGE